MAKTRTSTRSQSAKTVVSESGRRTRQIPSKRNLRQATVESVDSHDSTASTRRRGKAGHAARKMAIVPEEEAEESIEEEERVGDASANLSSLSVAAESQTSRTTGTSWGAGAIQMLDGTRVLQALPDLLDHSRKILNLLVSLQSVDAIAKDLQVPGSGVSVRMRSVERDFNEVREVYGEERFIQGAWILRKFFEHENPGHGDFRPDAVLQAANLATLAREVMILRRELRDAPQFLEILDRDFPKQFITGFDPSPKFGMSALSDETFDLSLEIRTQYLIAYLSSLKNVADGARMVANFPAKTLQDIFRSNTSRFEFFQIAGSWSEDQESRIQARISMIEASIYEQQYAAEHGDAYDEEKLSSDFPWLSFQIAMIGWIEARQTEIYQSIRQQGGVDNITKALTAAATCGSPKESVANHSQNDMHEQQFTESERPEQVVNVSDVVEKGSCLKRLKVQRTAARKLGPSPFVKPAEQAREPPGERIPATLDNGPRTSTPASPSQHLVSKLLISSLAYKDKENRPSKPRNFIDHQPNAEKLYWEDPTQANEELRNTRKRSREVQSPNPSEEAFQEDVSVIRSSRRQAAPRRDLVGASPQQAHKRSKRNMEKDTRASTYGDRGVGLQHDLEEEDDDDDDDIVPLPARNTLRSPSQRPRNGVEHDEDGEEGNDNDARPNFTLAAEAAKINTYRASQARGQDVPQRRHPWSVHDTNTLIDRIEQYNCCWSVIQKSGSWQRERDQVALRDKARNLKVIYLKSGTRLPRNFNNIRLGRKELDGIQKILPDYEE